MALYVKMKYLQGCFLLSLTVQYSVTYFVMATSVGPKIVVILRPLFKYLINKTLR